MLSKKTVYAFKALSHLAINYGKHPVSASEISQHYGIPLKFLETILNELKTEGLLSSKKGKGGGYSLLTPPDEITLARVIRLINGPIAMVPCASLYFYEKCDDCDELTCGFRKMMVIARDATLSVLEKKTLLDMVTVPELPVNIQ